MIAPHPPVGADRDDIGDHGNHRGYHAGERGTVQPECGRAEMPEDQHVVCQSIHSDGQRGDEGGEHRPAHDRDEDAQHCRQQGRHQADGNNREEFGRRLDDAGVLPGQAEERAAHCRQAHAGHAAKHRQPQCHAHRAPYLAHRVRPATQFGRGERRDRTDDPGPAVVHQPEVGDAKACSGQCFGTQPRNEHHVDGVHRHLQKARSGERRGQPRGRGQFAAHRRGFTCRAHCLPIGGGGARR